jgi:hypothetical protein
MNTKTFIKELRCYLRDNCNEKTFYLLKDGVLEWLCAEKEFVKNLTQASEKKWGQTIICSNSGQWTTRLGESILEEILRILGENPSRVRSIQKGENGKKLQPDFETELYLYENKCRTYTVSGTAGEKILGAPGKYCECPRLFGKPLFIVCMAYQEVEANEAFTLFNSKTPERLKLLKTYKDMNIEFIKATDLLKKILEFKIEN